MTTSTSHAFCFEEASARYGIPTKLLYAIAKHESGLNPAALNSSNKNGTHDIGIMQINSVHLKKLAEFGIKETDLWHACTNVMVGAWILADNIQRYGYNWTAVGAYNAKSPDKRERYAHMIASILKGDNRRHGH